jgi:hypothetical protein
MIAFENVPMSYKQLTNKEEIYDLLQRHPEGLDDDDITRLTGIQPRQQVQQLCNQLAGSKRIRRESVEKVGKRRKIHNFPIAPEIRASDSASKDGESPGWRRRLNALVAATGRSESSLLNEALSLLALKVLKDAPAEE